MVLSLLSFPSTRLVDTSKHRVYQEPIKLVRVRQMLVMVHSSDHSPGNGSRHASEVATDLHQTRFGIRINKVHHWTEVER